MDNKTDCWNKTIRIRLIRKQNVPTICGRRGSSSSSSFFSSTSSTSSSASSGPHTENCLGVNYPAFMTRITLPSLEWGPPRQLQETEEGTLKPTPLPTGSRVSPPWPVWACGRPPSWSSTWPRLVRRANTRVLIVENTRAFCLQALSHGVEMYCFCPNAKRLSSLRFSFFHSYCFCKHLLVYSISSNANVSFILFCGVGPLTLRRPTVRCRRAMPSLCGSIVLKIY